MGKMWHNFSWEEIVKRMGSDVEKGLSEEEAWSRQKKFGPNKLAEEKPLSRARVFFEQFKSPLIYILVVAGIITLILEDYTDAIIIFGAVFLNTIVGFFQENKTSKILQELKKMVKIKAYVIREGNKREIEQSELVPGDIFLLQPGNKIPTDGRLIESHNLKVNEASLTGEWLPAEKKTEILPEETSLADRDNMVYMGCMVEDGQGVAVTTEIGFETQIGKVAEMIKGAKEEKTPYQKRIIHLSKTIGVLIVAVSFLIFGLGVALGKGVFEMFLTAVAVAVAAIPEGLPVATTVILALGMQRILKKQGLVRKMVAAETLGSTSIACTDKTLTLTEGKMEVDKTITLNSKIFSREKLSWEDVFKQSFDRDQILLMRAAALCNEAFVENPEDPYPVWRTRGRPTDRALLVAGAEVGIKKHELEIIYFKEDEIPFNSENKYIATLIGSKPRAKIDKNTKLSHIRDPLLEGTEKILFVSGAPEKIMEISGQVQQKQKIALQLQEELEEMTGHGLRVLAVGYKKMGEKNNYKNLEDEVNDLTFIGFIGLKDPLRKEAKEAITICKKAGMRPIIVTGDHLLTAKAIGEELDLKTDKENIIVGEELDRLSDEEFQKIIKDVQIYARVEPRHKLRIIEAWQKKGEVVAMTGDGINDAAALKKADIGLALGSGTDVAKEASDLILLTDNFSIIVAAVEEGRAIIDNIRKTVTLLVSQSFSEIILVGASIIGGLPLPILPAQILWENLIEGSPQGIALAFEPKEKGIMERKPEASQNPLLTRGMKTIIFGFGIFTGFILLGLFLWLLRMGLPLAEIRTVIFAALAIDTFFYAFSCKNLRKNLWQYNPFSNLYLIFSIIFSLMLLLLAVYLPVFQSLLKIVPLNLFDWLMLLGLGMVNLVLIEATKYYFIVRHQTE